MRQRLFSCLGLGCHPFNSSFLPHIIVFFFVSCPLQNGSTALYIAAENGHDTVVKTLLEAHAAVDHADKVGVLK